MNIAAFVLDAFGAMRGMIAKLFGKEPQIPALHDLKRFQMLKETDEIANSAHTKADA